MNSYFPFQIAYKSEHEQEQGEYNYPAEITPSYQTQKKLEPLKDVRLQICNILKVAFTSTQKYIHIISFQYMH